MQSCLAIGLMSGTSMDGIDCALLETDGTSQCLKARGYVSAPYAPDFRLLLKATEYAVRLYEGDCEAASQHFEQAVHQYCEEALQLPPEFWEGMLQRFKEALGDSLAHSGQLTFEGVIQRSTDCHIKAAKQLITKLGLQPTEVSVVGYHGQCFYHQPQRRVSVILGDPQRMADALQIQVVNDFRREDIQAGGQGAPFAPIYHQALASRDNKYPLAVVNCGGIANVSYILGPSAQDLVAFDTGPGNALLDQLIRKRTQGQHHYDHQGEQARAGKVNQGLLKQLWDHSIIKDTKNYFAQKPPKSLDYGDLKLISALSMVSLPDACRTLAAFTAETIVKSIDWLTKPAPHHWVLAGGGWENPVILSEFKQRLLARVPEIHTIVKAEEMGWESQALEAQIFAYLAVRRLKELPLSFPTTTGVAIPMTGGTISLPI